MIKLVTLLREIGDNTAKPYTSRTVSLNDYTSAYSFETDSGTTYRIIIEKDYVDNDYQGNLGSDIEYELAFGVVKYGDKDEDTDNDPEKRVHVDFDAEVNDPKNLFRVMATVIDVIKKEIAEDEREEKDEKTGKTTKQAKKVLAVSMRPSKTKKDRDTGITEYDPADERRKKLYKAFIEKNVPKGSTVKESERDLVILLPEERPLKWKQS